MKILYIAPENTVGTLNLWVKAHESRGNSCQFVTLYPAKHDYDPGLCLNLPLVKSNRFYLSARHRYYQLFRGAAGDYAENTGYPPLWKPNFWLEQQYFRLRDWIWHFKIEPAIARHGLLDYDIIHLEWGLEFYRDGRFARRLHELGKPIVCTYHGQDLRTRGVIPAIDSISGLNITSELDLLSKHPDLQYLFLPFDTSQVEPNFELHDPIRICHSPTDRYYKGSETIIRACEELSRKEGIEFILIENKPFDEARALKQDCDILVDQVHNRGGWGYGMNSVEALSMGLCCATELVQQYVDFIPDHPFVNINRATIYDKLNKLVHNHDRLLNYKRRAREWVVKYHDLHNTAAVLYGYYRERGWL